MSARGILWAIALLIGLGFVAASAAQNLPPCGDRPTFRDPPWVDGSRYCLETVIRQPEAGELAFTALAVAPDGTLYAAHPTEGQVLAIRDRSGDGLPDTSEVAANGLSLPNGLAYYDGALYIAGGLHLYRLKNGQVETLVDDLPVGSSGWAGSLAVGPDERLYVSLGASCDFCQPDQPEHGAILSYALDGSDRRLVASGLRQAAGLAFFGGSLWATDSARTGLAAVPDLDELDRVVPGADFGWPGCIGLDNRPDPALSDSGCQSAIPPALSFPTGSTPSGIAAYTSDALPDLTGTLLVALNGSRNRVDLQGYALAAVHFDEAGMPTGYTVIIPHETDTPAKLGLSVAAMNYRASGLWPRRPLDVAVSPEGWVYLSIGSEILAVRPT